MSSNTHHNIRVVDWSKASLFMNITIDLFLTYLPEASHALKGSKV